MTRGLIRLCATAVRASTLNKLPIPALLLGSLLFGAPASQADSQPIRLATTTSTENSGLLDHLLPAFSKATGHDVHVIAVGTGKALRMGRDGDVDVVLVHAPPAEERFVAEGHGVERHPVMFNDFVIVGPKADPAGVGNSRTAAEALRAIATHEAPFISRGDDSGTHKKERALWHTAETNPDGSWYREAGQGMGKVLQIASETDAYTLTDRGTWLSLKAGSHLNLLFSGDPVLFNPYGIIRVSDSKYPDLNHAGAEALIAWLTGEAGQQLIASFRLNGEQLFTPSAKTATAQR
ncbi:MAG: substrate-binding domain-containing protein [Gammaproteobacteria bacterium]